MRHDAQEHLREQAQRWKRPEPLPEPLPEPTPAPEPVEIEDDDEPKESKP